MSENNAIYPPLEQDGIIFQPITSEYIEDAFNCIIKTFSFSDPLSLAVNLSPEDLRSFLDIFVRDNLLKQSMSTIARRKDTGEVIGCLLAEDLTTEPPADISGLPDNFMPIIALLEKLDGKFLENNPINPGEVAHLIMTGVSEGYMNRNIAFNLGMYSYNLCKERGFTAAITEATGKKSQRVGEKFGTKMLYSITYKEFEINGGKPFSSITDTDSIKLLHLDIK